MLASLGIAGLTPATASAYSPAARQYLRDVKPVNKAAAVYRLHEWNAEVRAGEDWALGDAFSHFGIALLGQHWPSARDRMAVIALSEASSEVAGALSEAGDEITEVETKHEEEERIVLPPSVLQDERIEEDTGLVGKLRQSRMDANALRRDLGLPPAR